MLTLASICSGLLAALVLFKLLFTSLDDFGRSFGQAFRLCYTKITFRPWLWALCSVGCGFAMYHLLPKYFPRAFP